MTSTARKENLTCHNVRNEVYTMRSQPQSLLFFLFLFFHIDAYKERAYKEKKKQIKIISLWYSKVFSKKVNVLFVCDETMHKRKYFCMQNLHEYLKTKSYNKGRKQNVKVPTYYFLFLFVSLS